MNNMSNVKSMPNVKSKILARGQVSNVILILTLFVFVFSGVFFGFVLAQEKQEIVNVATTTNSQDNDKWLKIKDFGEKIWKKLKKTEEKIFNVWQKIHQKISQTWKEKKYLKLKEWLKTKWTFLKKEFKKEIEEIRQELNI